MARTKIPDPLERRHLIERELAPAQAQRIADAYLAEGRSLEALDFLARAGDEEHMQAIRREAVEQGDGFLLRAVARLSDTPPRPEEWLALAEAAERAGKARYASDARRQAERGED